MSHSIIYPVEPKYTEDWSTLTGVASFNLWNNIGWTFDGECALSSGYVGAIDASAASYAYLPVINPPTFTGWVSSVLGVETGSPYTEMHTDVGDTAWQTGSTALTALLSQGSLLSVRFVFPTGDNMVNAFSVTYNMSFSSITDVNEFSDIDAENITGLAFTDAQKRSAIKYANAKIMYRIKDWNTFYNQATDTQVRKVLQECEAKFASANLFEKKAKQYINVQISGESFSVGDFSITQDPARQKTFYTVYHDLADRYEKEANKLLNMVVPTGENTIKSTFYFDSCKSVEEVEDIAIEEE